MSQILKNVKFHGFIVMAFLSVFVIIFISWKKIATSPQTDTLLEEIDFGEPIEELHPLSIEKMRQQSYPGSDTVIEQKLSGRANYNQYIASYKSEGLKIYALLTIPKGLKPEVGWPVIIFNHGYIPPGQYRTTEKYTAFVDAFARNGYVVFKPDYRGHGSSEGKAEGGYGSSAYTIDVLNALASIKRLQNPDSSSTDGPLVVDARRIGMWGHSMGGSITLRAMVVSKEIKAGVIWAGVVGSYADLLDNWRRRSPLPGLTQGATSWRQRFTERYGSPETNPDFWNSISPNSYLKDISGPIQLHHAKADSHVPFLFSEKLASGLGEIGKPVEFYAYNGDDHNLTNSFNTAINRTILFFDQNLK